MEEQTKKSTFAFLELLVRAKKWDVKLDFSDMNGVKFCAITMTISLACWRRVYHSVNKLANCLDVLINPPSPSVVMGGVIPGPAMAGGCSVLCSLLSHNSSLSLNTQSLHSVIEHPPQQLCVQTLRQMNEWFIQWIIDRLLKWVIIALEEGERKRERLKFQKSFTLKANIEFKSKSKKRKLKEILK